MPLITSDDGWFILFYLGFFSGFFFPTACFQFSCYLVQNALQRRRGPPSLDDLLLISSAKAFCFITPSLRTRCTHSQSIFKPHYANVVCIFHFTSEIHNSPSMAGKLLKSQCDGCEAELAARWAAVAMAVECLRASQCHPAAVASSSQPQSTYWTTPQLVTPTVFSK